MGAREASAVAAIMQSGNEPRLLPDPLKRRAAAGACSGAKPPKRSTITAAASISESESGPQRNSAHATAAYGKCFTLANPRPQLAVLGRTGVHDTDQEACVHVNHEVLGDNRRPAAYRSARASRAHCEISTLRSRNEACNRSRAASFELSSSLSSFAAIRMARRNTSDSGTLHLLANSSSLRTDSTSSE